MAQKTASACAVKKAHSLAGDQSSYRGGRYPHPAAPLGAAVLVGGVCVCLLAPEGGWLDTSELVAGSFGLGIIHPPGHPLPLVLGRLFGFVPLGSFGFRVALASAVELAGASAILCALTYRVLAIHTAAWFGGQPPARQSRLLNPTAVAAALTFGLCGSALLQGVRAEVYALNLLLVSGALWAALSGPHPTDRNGALPAARACAAFGQGPERACAAFGQGPGRARAALGTGLFCGLALSNHHLLAVVVTVPVFALVVLRGVAGGHGRSRAAGLFSLAAVLGLAAWIYLPLRAARHPLVNWGHPDRVGRFMWTISAQLFTSTAQKSVATGGGRALMEIVLQTVLDLGVGVCLLSVLGLYLSLRNKKTWLQGLGLALCGGGTAAAAWLAGFDRLNPDSRGYVLFFLFAIVLWAVLACALGLAWWTRWATRKTHSKGHPKQPGAKQKKRFKHLWAARTVAALFPLLALMSFARSIEDADRRQAWGGFAAGKVLLDGLPPHSVLLAAYHETVFTLWNHQLASGARPDVAVLFRHNLSLAGQLAAVRRRWPDLAALARALARSFRRGASPFTALVEAARQRPLFIEPSGGSPSDPLSLRLKHTLVDCGPFFAVTPFRQTRRQTRRHSRVAPTLRRALCGRTVHENWPRLEAVLLPQRFERGTLRYLVWKYYGAAWLLVARNQCERAERSLRRAWSLAPADPLLERLYERCPRLAVPEPRAPRLPANP
jgi:hypothetical protein